MTCCVRPEAGQAINKVNLLFNPLFRMEPVLLENQLSYRESRDLLSNYICIFFRPCVVVIVAGIWKSALGQGPIRGYSFKGRDRPVENCLAYWNSFSLGICLTLELSFKIWPSLTSVQFLSTQWQCLTLGQSNKADFQKITQNLVNWRVSSLLQFVSIGYWKVHWKVCHIGTISPNSRPFILGQSLKLNGPPYWKVYTYSCSAVLKGLSSEN
jgi:hypothetical protein